MDIEIDETPYAGESPDDFVTRMALEKARAGTAALDKLDLPVLAADTDVVVDSDILGKPANASEAMEILQRLSGRSHRVLSAVALSWQRERVLLSETTVHFRQLQRHEIEAYWQSGEPVGKAGGYGIQGIAAAFIEHIEGSYSGVMGLPLYETAELLRDADLPIIG